MLSLFHKDWSPGWLPQTIFLLLSVLALPLPLKDGGPLPLQVPSLLLSRQWMFSASASANPQLLSGTLLASLSCAFAAFPTLAPVSSRPWSVPPHVVPLWQICCSHLRILHHLHHRVILSFPSYQGSLKSGLLGKCWYSISPSTRSPS